MLAIHRISTTSHPMKQKRTPKKPKSDARIAGEVATYVLVGLALFVVLFIYVGA